MLLTHNDDLLYSTAAHSWVQIFLLAQFFNFLTLLQQHPQVIGSLTNLRGQNQSTVELHLIGLIKTANHPDMEKIRIIGFCFENRLN